MIRGEQIHQQDGFSEVIRRSADSGRIMAIWNRHPLTVYTLSEKISSLQRISSKLFGFYMGFANFAATASSKGHLRLLAAPSTTLAPFRVFEQHLCNSKIISKVFLGVSATMGIAEVWNFDRF